MVRKIALFILLLILSVSAFGQAVTPAPSLLNFQGRLAKPDGTPVTDGTYSVRFSLWTALSGGTEKWNQTVNPVTVRKGTFAVLLNVASPTDLFDQNRWLEIKIGVATPLTPRQQLVSVAFAMKANNVPDNAITSAKIANGTITGADIANGTITGDKLASGALNTVAWLLGGNSNTTASQFLGTTDNKPVILKANARQVMRYEDVIDVGDTYHTVNVLGGAAVNNIAAGVLGATVAGGGQDNNTGGDSPNEIWGNFGTVSGGSGNFIDAFSFGTIAGGTSNIVQGNYASISGGFGNNVQSDYTTIGGGRGNYVFGAYATIGGGSGNTASNSFATVGGGINNTASNTYATVGGGRQNTASNDNATVAGGDSNNASGLYATVGGGRQNAAIGFYAIVGGGSNNTASGLYATVAGGNSNTAIGNDTTVGGGADNVASLDYATVGGGEYNEAAATYAMVPGGYGNYAGGDFSFAAGRLANALHRGTFVWGDSTNAIFESSANNQFAIRAAGGMVLETGSNAFLYTSSTVGEKNRYFMLLNSPQTQSASGLMAGGILCADSYGYANPGKNNMVVKGTLGVGFPNPAPYIAAFNGSIYANGSYSGSDARYKKDIVTLDNALDKILNLRGVHFGWDKDAWKDQNFPDGKQIGFIAQEVEKVLPELVSTDSKGYKAVAYANVVPVLVEAMKTQERRLKATEAENAELKARNAAIEARLAEILQRLDQLEKK